MHINTLRQRSGQRLLNDKVDYAVLTPLTDQYIMQHAFAALIAWP